MTQTQTTGMVKIGEFGLAGYPAGHIWAKPEAAEAVRIAYDAIDEDNETPSALDDVAAAGGVYVVDR